MKNKVAIISVYFGQFPKNFEYTKKSIKFNKDYNWLIFSDQYNEEVVDNNLRFIPISYQDINNRLKYIFKEDFYIDTPYKMVDLKPMFGDLFFDYIKDCDWWGFTDLDVIYGNLNNFINDDVLDNFEVISQNHRNLFGPFTLLPIRFKNLYLEIENVKILIQTTGPSKFQTNCIDEKYFGDLIRNKKLKIYDSRIIAGQPISLVRCGKSKLPAVWRDGNVELHTLIVDYPEKHYLKYGADTLVLHLPKEKMRFIDISDSEFRMVRI